MGHYKFQLPTLQSWYLSANIALQLLYIWLEKNWTRTRFMSLFSNNQYKSIGYWMRFYVYFSFVNFNYVT